MHRLPYTNSPHQNLAAAGSPPMPVTTTPSTRSRAVESIRFHKELPPRIRPNDKYNHSREECWVWNLVGASRQLDEFFEENFPKHGFTGPISSLVTFDNYIDTYIYGEILFLELIRQKNVYTQSPQAILDYIQDCLKPGIPEPYFITKIKLECQIALILGARHPSGTFPREDVYRFTIDGIDEAYGAYAYEDECGFILAYYNALIYALKDEPGSAFDYDFYLKLRDLSIENVFGIFRPHGPGFLFKGYGGKYIAIGSYDYDLQGKDDSRQTVQTTTATLLQLLLPCDLTDDKDITTAGSMDNGTKLLQNNPPIFFKAAHLYAQRNKDKPEEQLIAWLWLSHELFKRHVLADGNSRSAHCAFLNRIWRMNNIPMVLLHDPNIFGQNSLEKACYRIIEGMINFIDYGRNSFPIDGSAKKLSDLDERLKQEKYTTVAQFHEKLKAALEGKTWVNIHADMEEIMTTELDWEIAQALSDNYTPPAAIAELTTQKA